MSVIPVNETLKYINEARTHPRDFAKYVKKELDSFINNSTLPLKPGCNYATNEGKSAWNEAYQFLLNQKPLPAYQLNQGLNLAAEDHAIDMAKSGIFGHNSSDGKPFTARIEKRCGKAYGSSGENIGTDFMVKGRNHALQTVMGLIIDDGVTSRGHRKNIFSTDFKYIGIASRVQDDKIITVMDFHSQNLGTQSGTSNYYNHAGSQLKYDEPKKSYGGYNFGKFDNDPNPSWGDWKTIEKGHGMGGKGYGHHQEFSSGSFKDQSGFDSYGTPSKVQEGSGGRTVVSKSTNTKSSTVNGIKTMVKTTKLKYSDGTEEQEVEETTQKVY